MNGKLIKSFQEKDYLIVVIAWLLFESIWFYKFGFNFQQEATKYIDEANFISDNHHFSQGRYLFYLSTIIIIAVSFLLKTGLYGAVITIMVINLFSYLYFFKALRKNFVNPVPRFLIILFLLSF